MTWRRATLASASVLVFASLVVAVSTAGPPSLDREPGYLDALLGRPYTGGTPLRATGPSLWATHPVGWGFPNDVHYVQLDWLEAFRVEIAWDGLAVEPGAAWAHVGHLRTWALPPGDLALNLAASGLPAARGPDGEAWLAIDGDRRALAYWRGEPDPGGETWLEVELLVPSDVSSLLLTLVEDPSRGLALPAALRVEWLSPTGLIPVANPSHSPSSPAAGPNRVAFDPVTASVLRVTLSAPAPVAVSELEVYAPGRAPLELGERKTISGDDTLISVMTATNLGTEPKTLRLEAASALLAPSAGVLAGQAVLHTVPVSFRLELEGAALDGAALVREVLLEPGASIELTAGMAFARSPAEAAARTGRALADPDPIAAKDLAAARWFLENVPQLDVPDPWFEKAYAFRFEVARRTMTDPKWGPLRHPTFEEGRWSAPWFARPITYGAPHQLREVRWLRDSGLSRGHALTFVENARLDGAFVSVPLTGPQSEYTDWIAAAIWQVYLVTGDTDLLGRSLAAMRDNLDYVLTKDGDRDRLPVVEDHFITGMEWQPAFFYFNDFFTDVATPLERVDYAAALFANALATADAATALCDPAARSEALALAAEVRAAVESKMWDEATSFYYSLREADDEKSLVREIVGFYPFAFGLAGASRDRAVAALFDPLDFWTAWPPASSSLTCPATSQDGWPIGPGGSQAMWNGPTWPHAISLAAEAVARVIRRSGEGIVRREQLFDLLESYTRAHYYGAWWDRDFAEPLAGEYYHGNHGLWKTGERDYFHSTYADLVISFLVGIEPAADSVVRLDPLLPAGEWERFLLERAPYRGHELTVVWDEPGGIDAYADGHEGLELYIDGELAAARPDLGALEAPLPSAALHAVKDPASPAVLFETETTPPWTLYRATDPALAGASALAGSPFSLPEASDPAPPPAPLVYYRSGACGHGR